MTRAAVIPAPNHPVEVREYPRPDLEDGAALVLPRRKGGYSCTTLIATSAHSQSRCGW